MAKLYSGINGVAIKENRALTRSELLAVVPSVFASEAHESRSDRFAPISTIDVLDRLAKENYMPFFATQAKVRDTSKREFTKHMLRLRRDIGQNDGEANEIILLNANDGTSAYQLIAGQFRFVCANGLVMGNTTNRTKIYHKGNNIMDDVIEGVYSVVKDFDKIENYKEDMLSIDLNDKERKTFALAGYIIKEGMPENIDNLLYRPESLLSHAGLNTKDRYDSTLYSTFNTVQQHLMNGGQRGHSETGRRRSSRGVTNIDKNIDINSRLWDLATDIVERKIPKGEIIDAVLA